MDHRGKSGNPQAAVLADRVVADAGDLAEVAGDSILPGAKVHLRADRGGARVADAKPRARDSSYL